MNKQTVCILGSTGSIGKSTLDVISRHPDDFVVFALSAFSNVELMFKQCLKFTPSVVVMVDDNAALELSGKLKVAGCTTQVMSGAASLEHIAAQDCVDTVMAAIVGAAGLLSTLAAVEAGKKLLLANKEALVMTGQLFMDKVKRHNATLLPIDSEHNAIFQCLPQLMQQNGNTSSLQQQGISKILLTGSGGPFLTKPLDQFEMITPAQAVAHPNWSMGQKISVDSATMMNKGLEFIEACVMFNLKPENIEVVLHPQSVIHSMVQYVDGSVLAQMGEPDMRTPIAHALAYPQRIESGVKPLDFFSCKDFTFAEPDFDRYPNLKLAMEACIAGQGATTVLNAANEVGVAAFLNEQIGFCDIHRINAQCLSRSTDIVADSVTAILEIDRLTRAEAQQQVASIGQRLSVGG
jgi:1-deoxy-D-xylulose-5-phosphate reductoisomerase